MKKLINDNNPLCKYLGSKLTRKNCELTNKNHELKKVNFEIFNLENKLAELYDKQDFLEWHIEDLVEELEELNKFLNSTEIKAFNKEESEVKND